jgi:hypothetical protein
MKQQQENKANALINTDLVDGYGVEDIAVRRRIPLEYVRFRVRVMRATGRLSSVIEAARMNLARAAE